MLEPKRYQLTSQKSWNLSQNCIIFFTMEPFKHSLVQIFDLKNKNQKHICLDSEERLQIKNIYLSDNQSRLVLQLKCLQKGKDILQIIELTSNAKYPTIFFKIQSFDLLHFYLNDIYIAQTQKSVFLFDSKQPKRKQFLVKDKIINKVVIGTHLNIIFVICKDQIVVIWMDKTDQNFERKVKKIQNNNIIDIILHKQKLFLLRQNSFQQSDLSYFQNQNPLSLKKFNNKIQFDKLISMKIRKSKQNLQIILLQPSKIHFINLQQNTHKTHDLYNINADQLKILYCGDIWIASSKSNQLIQIKQKLESDYQLSQDQRSQQQTISPKNQKVLSGIRIQNAQNLILNLSSEIAYQPHPLFYQFNLKIPKFYGSQFVEFRSIYTIYKYMSEDIKYFEIDDISIPIRQISPETQQYIPQIKLQVTSQLKKNLKKIMIAVQQSIPALLEGEAACGKTTIIQFLANITNTPLFRINLNNFTGISDILGKSNIAERNQIKFALSNFTNALQKGYWILLDQANLSKDQVLNVIQHLFSLQKVSIVTSSITGNIDQKYGVLNVRKHPRFQLFLAQNPGGEGYVSRNFFSESLLSNMICIKMESIPIQQLKQIISKKLQNAKFQDSKVQILSRQQIELISSDIMTVYQHVKNLQKKQKSVRNISIRDLQLICDIYTQCYVQPSSLAGSLSIKLCFTQTLDQKINKEFINQKVDQLSSFTNLGLSRHYFNQLKKLNIKFIQFEDEIFSFCDLCKKTKKPGLIYSKPGSGKFFTLQKWAQIRKIDKENIIIVNLTKQTQVQNLFGKVYINDDKRIKQKYIFKDGPVTKAIKQGKVLILRGLDRVDAAVSQSLNGILQTGQNRAVCIYDQYITIKPSTLIFATADVSNLKQATNFSPALLSRFFSIYQPTKLSKSDLSIVIENNLKILTQKKQLIINALQSNIKSKQKDIQNSNFQIKFLKQQSFFYINILKNFIQSKVLLQKYGEKELKQIITNNLQFFVRISQQKTVFIKSEKQYNYPFSFDKIMSQNYKKRLSFTLTDSRQKVANAIAFCIATKLPIILQGKAGIGKSKIIDLIELFFIYNSLKKKKVIISINKTTTINDLMGSIKLTKQQAIVEKGSLKKAIQTGMIVLLDQFNLASQPVHCFIQQILKYPEQIIDPVTGGKLKIHQNFRILATQNPSSYEGRKPLPDSIKNKMILIEVPLYLKQQIVQICEGKLMQKNKKQNQLPLEREKIQYLVNMFAYCEDDSQLNTKSQEFINKSKFTTLRIYVKLCKRLRKLFNQSKTGQYLKSNHWKEYLQLNSTLVFPEETLDEFKVKIKNKQFKQNKNEVQCVVSSKNCYISVSLPLNLKNINLIEKFNHQSQKYKLTLVNLFFCRWFKENLLLISKTTHKSTAATEFSKLIKFENCPQPLTTLYLSNLTEMTQILGSIEPHTPASYLDYLKTRIGYFQEQIPKQIKKEDIIQFINQKYNKVFHTRQLENFTKFINQKYQFFTICQRNLLPAIRYGGIVLFQNVNLIQQSKMQGLNSLFEIDSSYTFDNEQLIIHDQFMVIATVHLPTLFEISPAFRSRFCVVNIDEDDFLDKIEQQIKKGTFKSDIQKQFIRNFIKLYKQINPTGYKQLNQKHLYNWLQFYNLELKQNLYQNVSLAKIIIGSEILFTDNLQLRPINLQDELRNKIKTNLFHHQQIIQVYKKLNEIPQDEVIMKEKDKIYLKYMGLRIYHYSKSNKFIYSRTAIKNIFRVICASYTKLNLNLKGPPGIGKSAVCQVVSQIQNKKFFRICCSENMQLQDLFGSYIPKMNLDSMEFIFQIGKVLQALSEKNIQPLILFDEINMAPSDVLSGLIKLFNSNDDVIQIKDHKVTKGKTIFICAMNPPNVGGGRKDLPDIITNQLCPINLDNLSTQQLTKIAKNAYQKKINKYQANNFQTIIKIHTRLEQYNPNIRHFQNISAILSTCQINQKNYELLKKQKLLQYYCTLTSLLVYSSLNIKNQQEKEKRKIQDIIVSEYGYKSIQEFKITQKPTQLYIQNGRVLLKRNNRIVINKLRNKRNVWFQTPVPLKYSQRQISLLEKLLLTIESKRPILIEGERVSGKTTLALQFARLTNRPYIYFCINYQTEISDLLGGICPTNQIFFQTKELNSTFAKVLNQLNTILLSLNFKDIKIFKKITQNSTLEQIEKILISCNKIQRKKQLLNLLQKIKKYYHNLKSNKGGIKFKFNPGILRYAMKQGLLLILDNVDLAKPVVIERFNSIGEENGKLYINQVGAQQCDFIHPDYAIIYISNPKRAQANKLSDAFMNRAIKIQIQSEFKNQNFIDHIFATLNTSVDTIKLTKHNEFEYKLSHCIKNIYKNIQQNKYSIQQSLKTKGFTINQKNIIYFQRITAKYGIQNSLPLFFNFYKNIESYQIQLIKQNQKNLKMKRPKLGVLQTKQFEPVIQEKKQDIQTIKTVKQLMSYLKNYGKLIFHEQFKNNKEYIKKQKIDQFEGDNKQIYSLVNYITFGLNNLQNFKFQLHEIIIYKLEKMVILNGQCIISKFKNKMSIQQILTDDFALIKVDLSSLRIQQLNEMQIYKNIFKTPFDEYIPQFFTQILTLQFTINMTINYKTTSAFTKININFKNKLRILNFLQIDNIKCEINFNKRLISLFIVLSINGQRLGQHTIILSLKSETIKYQYQFDINSLFKIIQIPQMLNILPITNFQIDINLKKEWVKIHIFSKQKIESITIPHFSLRNPNIMLVLSKNKTFQITFFVDLYLKDTLITTLNQDIFNMIGKKLQIKQINFQWSKEQNFNVQTQILPIFQSFNMNKSIISIVKKFFNSISSIKVKFQKLSAKSFRLYANFKFKFNKQVTIFTFDDLQLQIQLNSLSQNYSIAACGTLQLNLQCLPIKKMQLKYALELRNQNEGIKFYFNFNPQIKNLQDLFNLIVDKSKLQYINLQKFNLQKSFLPLKYQIQKQIKNNLCCINNKDLHLEYKYKLQQKINPFGFDFIQLKNIQLQSSITFPAFKYQIFLSGQSIFFKGLQINFEISFNNQQWKLTGKKIKNNFSINKIISYFFNQNINIQAFNKEVNENGIQKVLYDIKNNQIDVNLSIPIQFRLSLLSVDCVSLQYKGIVGKDTIFKINLALKLFQKNYIFTYDYRQGLKLPDLNKIQLVYKKNQFNLYNLLEQNDLNFFVCNKLMKQITIGQLTFSLQLQDLNNLCIKGTLLKGQCKFSLGNLIRISLGLQKINLELYFNKLKRFQYCFQLKAFLSINQYQLGFVNIEKLRDKDEKKLSYGFNKINTRKLFKALIDYQLQFLPEQVQISINNPEIFTKGFDCEALQINLTFQEFKITSNLSLKNNQFNFYYDKNKASLVQKINKSNLKSFLWYQNHQIGKISGEIIKQSNQSLLKISMNSKSLYLSQFFKKFLNLSFPKQFDSIILDFKFEMKYYLFKKQNKGNSSYKSLQFQVQSKKFDSFSIWGIFSITLVKIEYKSSKWLIFINIKLFQHEMTLSYQNGKIKSVKQIIFQFNKVVSCLVPSLAKVFNFKMVLKIFECDFTNSLQILMQSPQNGGQWIIMKNNHNEKLLYLDKLTFEYYYNKTENRSTLSLKGSFFIGTQELVRIDYSLNNSKNKMNVISNQGIKYFNIKKTIKMLTEYTLDFLPDDFSASIFKIDYNDEQSKNIISKLHFLGSWDKINKVQLGIKIKQFYINIGTFKVGIQQATFNVIINNKQSGIQKIFGSSMIGIIQIGPLKLEMKLNINQKIQLTAQNTESLSLNKLLQFFSLQKIQFFSDQIKINSYQIKFSYIKNKNSKKYQFQQFQCSIKNLNLMIFNQGSLKLIFKSIELNKIKNSQFTISAQIQFLDNKFMIIYQDKKIRLQNQKASKNTNIMKILDESQFTSLQAKFKGFQIQKRPSQQFIVSMNFSLNKKDSTLFFIYSHKTKSFIGVLQSQYFPQPYYKILQTCLGIKQIKTKCCYIRGNLENIDFSSIKSQQLNQKAIEKYKNENYSQLCRIQCKIKIDNIITRLLNLQNTQVNLLYQKHNKSQSPLVEIYFGQTQDPFNYKILPSTFQTKCLINKEQIKFSMIAKNSQGSFQIQFLRQTKAQTQYSVQIIMKIYNLLDLFEIQGTFKGTLKHDLSISAAVQLGIKIKPLDLQARAAIKVILSKKKSGISYIAFSLTKLSLKKIIEKLFNVKNQTILQILSWLPTIQQLQILSGGFGIDLDGQNLPQSLVKKGFPQKVYLFHKYLYCQLEILKTRVKFRFQLSIKKIMFKFEISPINIFWGLIRIDAFNIQFEASAQKLSLDFKSAFKSTLTKTKSLEILSEIGNKIKQIKVSACGEVHVRILGIIDCKVQFILGSNGFYCQLLQSILGIKLEVIIVISPQELRLKGSIGTNIGQVADKSYYQNQFIKRGKAAAKHKDYQVQEQIESAYDNFLLTVNQISLQIACSDLQIQISIIYNVVLCGFRLKGILEFTINLKENIIIRFIKQLFDLIIPDWLKWWTSKCQKSVKERRQNGGKGKLKNQQSNNLNEKSSQQSQQQKNEQNQSGNKNKNQNQTKPKQQTPISNQKMKLNLDSKGNPYKYDEQQPTKTNINLPQYIQCGKQGIQKPPNYTYCYCKKGIFKGQIQKSCNKKCQKLLFCGCKCQQTCHPINSNSCGCSKPKVNCFCKKKKQMHVKYDCGNICPVKRQNSNCNHPCLQKQCHQFCTQKCVQKCNQLLQCNECYCQNKCGTCKQSHAQCKLSVAKCFCGKNKGHTTKSCKTQCNKKKQNCNHQCKLICHEGKCKECQKKYIQCLCGRKKQVCQSDKVQIKPCNQRCLWLLSSCKHPCNLNCHQNSIKHQCSVFTPCFCKKNLVQCFTQSCKTICGKRLCPHKTCRLQCHQGDCRNQAKQKCNQPCNKLLSCKHLCKKQCNHLGSCYCTQTIKSKCDLGLHQNSHKCGQKVKCMMICGFKYSNCQHVCQQLCYEHINKRDNRHKYCQKNIKSKNICFSHQKIKEISHVCSSTSKNGYSCLLKCQKKLTCNHQCKQICHQGQCKCKSSICFKCKKPFGTLCNGKQIMKCNNVCSYIMKCGHQCKQICHQHNQANQKCNQYKSIICFQCFNHPVLYKCNQGYNGLCPNLQKVFKIKQLRKKQSKKIIQQNFKKQQNQKLNRFNQQFLQSQNTNTFKAKEICTLNIQKQTFANNIEYSKLFEETEKYIMQLLNQNKATIVSSRIRLIIDSSFCAQSHTFNNYLFIILQLINLSSSNVEIIVSGNIVTTKAFYLKNLYEPLNIDKIIQLINFLNEPLNHRQNLQSFCNVQQKLPEKIDLILVFTKQTMELQEKYFFQISNFIGQIYLIQQFEEQKMKKRINNIQFQNTNYKALCKDLLSKKTFTYYCEQQPVYQKFDQQNTLKIKNQFQNNRDLIFEIWKRFIYQKKEISINRIPYSEIKINQKKIKQKNYQKVTPQKPLVTLSQLKTIEDFKQLLTDIVDINVLQIRKTVPDLFTKYSFSNTGIITERSIIKAQSTNYTSTQIYQKRIAGPKHFKPTILVFDLTSTSSQYLITKFIPTIFTIIFTLEKINFSYGIITITNKIKYIKTISQKLQPARLFQSIFESICVTNTASTLFTNGLIFAINDLYHLNCSNQSSIILLSNSLHLIPHKILAEIQEDCLNKKIILTVITYLKYQSISLRNAYLVQNFATISQIFRNFYHYQQVNNSQSMIQKKNSLLLQANFISNNLTKNLNNLLNKNTKKIQKSVKKQTKIQLSNQKIQIKNKFLNSFMQYYKGQEQKIQQEQFDQQVKQSILKVQSKQAQQFCDRFFSLVEKIEMSTEDKETIIRSLLEFTEQILNKTKDNYLQYDLDKISKLNKKIISSSHIFIQLLSGGKIITNSNSLQLQKRKQYQIILYIIKIQYINNSLKFQNLVYFCSSINQICKNSLKSQRQKVIQQMKLLFKLIQFHFN